MCCVQSVAQEIYKKIYDTREFKGRKTDTLVATCLYIACKVEGVPRSLKGMSAQPCVLFQNVYYFFQRFVKNWGRSVVMSDDVTRKSPNWLRLKHHRSVMATQGVRSLWYVLFYNVLLCVS